MKRLPPAHPIRSRCNRPTVPSSLPNVHVSAYELILRCPRQAFDNSYDKVPSQGWSFIPLEEYHGGGAAATLEPLRANLADYEAALASAFGWGIQPAFRGGRLYDGRQMRGLLRRWVGFLRRHRPLLTGDVIHLGRPEVDRVDHVLHVQPDRARGRERALLFLFNPATKPLRALESPVPLHYAGVHSGIVCVSEFASPSVTNEAAKPDTNHSYSAEPITQPWLEHLDARARVRIPPREVAPGSAGVVYFVFEDAMENGSACGATASAASEIVAA